MRSRDKILDATLGLIGEAGFAAVNIAAIAAAAKVSRQTVYSIFGSRDEVVSQALSGLLMRVLGELRRSLDAADTPCGYVVELIVSGRTALRTDPVLATLLETDLHNPLFDATMMQRARPIARELLAPMAALDPAAGEHLDDIVDIGLHLGLSVVMFDDPAHRSDAELRAFLTRWLAPAMP